MKLLVGLGNPGPQYAHTRHNLGFMVVDEIAHNFDADWHSEAKFQSVVAEASLNGQKFILAKPQTFMNLSGEAVQKLMRFYKTAPADVWVIFDDVDTPFGRLRLRTGGSGSGHQGVNSVIQHIGPNFNRGKLGISLNDRTREPSEVYVLKPFNPDEQAQLPNLIERAAQIITDQIQTGQPEDTTFDLL